MNPELFSLPEEPENEKKEGPKRPASEEEKLNDLLAGMIVPDLVKDDIGDHSEDDTVKDVPAIPDEGNWQEDSMGGRPPQEHDDSGNASILHDERYHR
jgi:hypothetical protein